MAKEVKTEAVSPKYTKGQLLAAKRYEDKQDIISALLENDKIYTLAETNELIENYLKGGVK